MLTFAVVVSRSGGPVPRAVGDRLRDRGNGDVPFSPASHLVWSNDGESVCLGGWQDAPGEWSRGNNWHVDDDGLTAFSGHVWPRGAAWTGPEPWAAQLARFLGSTPLAEAVDDLAGVYVAASLPREGPGVVAADALGNGIVYWGEGRDIVVVSSRAAVAAGLLAAESGAPAARDVLGTGWLAFCGRSIAAQTGFERVTVVPPGIHVAIDAGGGAHLVADPSPPWRPGAGRETSLEAARDEMAAFIRAALALPGRNPCAGLTGGKDSRLLLALLLEEGIAGEVEFQTSGQDDLPDVAVAKEIAARFDLRHVMNPDRAEVWAWRQAVDGAVHDRDPQHAELSSREIALRITASTGSGERSVLEPHLGRPPVRDRVLLSGLFGETLRTNFPEATAFRSKRRVADLPRELSFGTAGILRPEVLAHYRRETHALLFDDCVPTDGPQDVVDRFFFRNWQRRWFTTTQEIDSQSRVFPLYSTTALRFAFSIGAESRHAEWIHYQLISRACAPLLTMRFADGGWPAHAGDALTPPRTHRDRVPSGRRRLRGLRDDPNQPRRPKKPLKRTAGRDRRASVEAEDLAMMRRYLVDDASNPLFEIADPVATRHALDRFDSLMVPQKLQLYGALTAAIWLGGHEIALPREP